MEKDVEGDSQEKPSEILYLDPVYLSNADLVVLHLNNYKVVNNDDVVVAWR